MGNRLHTKFCSVVKRSETVDDLERPDSPEFQEGLFVTRNWDQDKGHGVLCLVGYRGS